MIQPLALNPFVTTLTQPERIVESEGVMTPLLMAYDTHATALPNFGYSMHALTNEPIPGMDLSTRQTASTFQRLNVVA